MSFIPEQDTTLTQTPVFYETIAAALNTDPPSAVKAYQDVSEVTDLHRVEETLERAATPDEPAE